MMKIIRSTVALLFTLLLSIPVLASSDRFDLDNYGYRTVVINGKGTLVFQNSPDGTFMNDYQYSDGEQIYVNLAGEATGTRSPTRMVYMVMLTRSILTGVTVRQRRNSPTTDTEL